MKSFSINTRLIGIAFSLAAGALFLQGCASIQGGQSGAKEDVKEVADAAPDTSYIIKGKSTKAQMIAKLGSPSKTTVNRNGETLAWSSSDVKVSPQTYIPIWGSFNGGVKTTTKVLSIDFNKKGIVSDFAYEVGVENQKIGL